MCAASPGPGDGRRALRCVSSREQSGRPAVLLITQLCGSGECRSVCRRCLAGPMNTGPLSEIGSCMHPAAPKPPDTVDRVAQTACNCDRTGPPSRFKLPKSGTDPSQSQLSCRSSSTGPAPVWPRQSLLRSRTRLRVLRTFHKGSSGAQHPSSGSAGSAWSST